MVEWAITPLKYVIGHLYTYIHTRELSHTNEQLVLASLAIFVVGMKHFNALATYCGRAYSIRNKQWLEDTLHELQAILLIMVVISYTFCLENEKELIPRGVWQ